MNSKQLLTNGKIIQLIDTIEEGFFNDKSEEGLINVMRIHAFEKI